jgi:hypothetical protein
MTNKAEKETSSFQIDSMTSRSTPNNIMSMILIQTTDTDAAHGLKVKVV